MEMLKYRIPVLLEYARFLKTKVNCSVDLHPYLHGDAGVKDTVPLEYVRYLKTKVNCSVVLQPRLHGDAGVYIG